jgi:hypothetical protein
LFVGDPQREAAASLVLSHCELERVRVRSCIAESGETIADLKSPFSFALSDPKGRSLGIIRNHLVVEITVAIESLDSAEEQNLVLRFGCVFQLTYHLHDKFVPTEEQMEAFADKYGVFNSWPYVRETFQNLSQRMGLSPPVLPLLRIDGGHSQKGDARSRKRR